jgi:hypothetical protein
MSKSKTIRLTENDRIFVHYVLKYYAQTTEGLDDSDKQDIYKVASNFE